MAIVGASFDAPATNAAWAADEGFAFELWTDDTRALATYYGAADSPSAAAATRLTVLLDADGALAVWYADGIDVGTHPDDVLHDCTVLYGG